MASFVPFSGTYSTAALVPFSGTYSSGAFVPFSRTYSTAAFVPFFARISEQPLFQFWLVFRSSPCSDFCTYSATALVLFLARIPASFFHVFRQPLFWFLHILRQPLFCTFEAAFDMFFSRIHAFFVLFMAHILTTSLCSVFLNAFGQALSCFCTHSSDFFMFFGSFCPIVLQILKQPLMLISRNPAASFLFLKTYSGSLTLLFHVFEQPFFSFFEYSGSLFSYFYSDSGI